MAWTDITREQHKRAGLRYPSDLTDAEWAMIVPLLPPARSGGRSRTTDLREVVNAILYLASSGCQWCMLPKDFHRARPQGYFYEWRNMGPWQSTNHLPGAGGARGVAERRDHRKPIGEDHRKWRGLRLRRGQEAQGAQAPHRHRRARADALRARACRRHPGPRRRGRPRQGDPPPFPLGCAICSPMAATPAAS